MVKMIVPSLAVLVFLAIPLQTALAEDFYKGKTIRFVVGLAPGGGYDTYARMMARHISRHIPGNPETVVENMTGAGSLVAANHLYKQATPDGLALAMFNNSLVVQ